MFNLKIFGSSLRQQRVETAPASSDKAYTIVATDGSGAMIDVAGGHALGISAVWACAMVLANAFADPTWRVYRRTADGREEIPDHPNRRVVNFRPSADLSAFDFRHARMLNTALWGNGIAEISRTKTTRRPAELHHVATSRVRADRDRSGRVIYEISNRGRSNTVLDAADVLHLRGLSIQGIWGRSVVETARRSMQLTAQAEAYGERLFRNDARPSMLLKHPKALSDKAYNRLREWWIKKGTGESQHGVQILEEGLDATPVYIPPEDAQFLQTRQFQAVEVCRWFGVKPHMIGDLAKATFSNIEQQAIEFVRYCLAPWVKRDEQEFDYKLLPESDHGRVYHRANLESMLRGDISARFAAYQIGINSGIYSPDEVREKEDMNPQPNGLGRVYARPLSQFPQAQQTPTSRSTDFRRGVAIALENAATSVVKREAKAIAPVVRSRGVSGAAEWFDTWATGHADYSSSTISRALIPLFAAAGVDDPDRAAATISSRWARDRVDAVRSIVSSADSPEILSARLDWATESPTSDIVERITEEAVAIVVKGSSNAD